MSASHLHRRSPRSSSPGSRSTYPDRTVLTGVDLLAQPGRRIGLVGENGVGKSTLLRAVAGRLPARARVSGRVEAPDDLVLLGQEPPFRDRATVAEVLAMTLAPLRTAVADVERLAGAVGTPAGDAAYERALEAALAHDAWDADRRADRGGRPARARRPRPGDRVVGTLSGRPAHPAGARHDHDDAADLPAARRADQPPRRRRDRGAHRLPARPAGRGACWPATTGCCSTTCAPTWSTSTPASSAPTGAAGAASAAAGAAYEAARADARRRWEETYAAQQEEIARLRDATRIGTGAIAHDRGPTDGDKYIYSFKGGRVDQTLAAAQEGRPAPARGRRARAGAQAAGAAAVPRRPDRRRRPGGWCRCATSRSPGGCGSRGSTSRRGSTCCSPVPTGRASRRCSACCPAGWRDPRHGRRLRPHRPRAHPGPGGRRPVALRAGDVRRRGARPRRRPAPCASSGCCTRATTARRSAACRSGQRRRLGLAVAIAAAPDLLLLDEPTNHVSLALAGELEEALATAPGGVVLASHDRWLRRRWEGPELALTPW